MNRLILIGNGFDLAHGLKTSYCHFISDYIARAINNFYETNNHSDILLSIRFRSVSHGHSPEGKKKRVTPDEALSHLRLLEENINYFVVDFKSTFLKESIFKINTLNWVDLENDYFERLIKCKELRTGFNINHVNNINDEFDFLKMELESYLLRVQFGSKEGISTELLDIFYGKVNSRDIITCQIGQNVLPTKILFLSFNYTNTIEKYINSFYIEGQVDINYIHGKLDFAENPIIFGFGDEYNKNYLEFEELKSNELLTHIKSFGYFNASNYHDLMKFLEDDLFEVYSFGHSLGLSDRTMLKEVFENENCKSIRIFYHKNRKDYINKTYDISKHFTNKGIMRKKIVPFTRSFAMPQPKE